MKVVFIQDVPNVARAGEIKEVASGYGRNFLIPQKLAILATPAAIGTMETELKKRAHRQEQTEAELVELANQLDGKEIILKAQIGAKDRLYGSITAADIADALQNITGLITDKRKIELDKPIRQLGSYEVAIRLGKDIIPTIKVTVERKKTEAEKELETEKKTRAKKKTEVEKEPKAEKKTKAKKKTEVEKEPEIGKKTKARKKTGVEKEPETEKETD